jgi:hypothetical protein
MRSRLAAGVVLAALALPAAASAHPGVYTVTQKVAGAGCTFPTTGCLTDRTQYAVANDGWALGFTEDNALISGGGLINYKAMPSSWRAPMTSDEKRTFAAAQTNLQAHATCSGTALDNGPNILAWQGNDPFFNYVPWQSKSGGLGEDPAKWIAVVKSVTGVDLTGMTDAQAQTACTNAGGTYHKADTPAGIADALLASVTGPLQSQVSQLQNQVGGLQAGKAAADAALSTALARPLALTLSAKRFDSPVAMVTGVPGTVVKVRVLLSAADARRLKISRVAASKTRTLGAQGAELFTLTPAQKVAASRHALKVTIEAAGGGKTLTSKGTLR